MSFSVKVDFREKDSGVAAAMEKAYGAKVTYEVLKSGDYVIDNHIAVERKTGSDFVLSIIDGRLFRQAESLKKSYGYAVMIVEGGNIYNTQYDISINAVKGALINMSVIWRIPILFSESPEDTAYLISLMAGQYHNIVNEWYNRHGRRPKQFFRQQIHLLQGLPGVGPKLAREMLEHFLTPEAVFTAPEEELMAINMIGGLKASKIREILTKTIE